MRFPDRASGREDDEISVEAGPDEASVAASSSDDEMDFAELMPWARGPRRSSRRMEVDTSGPVSISVEAGPDEAAVAAGEEEARSRRRAFHEAVLRDAAKELGDFRWRMVPGRKGQLAPSDEEVEARAKAAERAVEAARRKRLLEQARAEADAAYERYRAERYRVAPEEKDADEAAANEAAALAEEVSEGLAGEGRRGVRDHKLNQARGFSVMADRERDPVRRVELYRKALRCLGAQDADGEPLFTEEEDSRISGFMYSTLRPFAKLEETFWDGSARKLFAGRSYVEDRHVRQRAAQLVAADETEAADSCRDVARVPAPRSMAAPRRAPRRDSRSRASTRRDASARAEGFRRRYREQYRREWDAYTSAGRYRGGQRKRK